MNKQDFADWKRHPITEVVFSQLTSRIKDLQDQLGNSAGINPILDSQRVGAIKAYTDMVLTEYEGE